MMGDSTKQMAALVIQTKNLSITIKILIQTFLYVHVESK